jgi:hypothetical protein
VKIKAACVGTPQLVVQALSGTPFASMVLSAVIGRSLGVENVLERPAEYYVQDADVGPAPKAGVMGVEVRLTGASRSGRTPKQFHNALKELYRITREAVRQALSPGQKCQVFCVIMIDGEIETAAGSGVYSNNLEGPAEWVEIPRHH